MKQEPTPELRALFEEARRYEEAKDHYNAVKLYKRIIREARHWALPYIRLGEVYKYRQEWKPALYYNKKAVSLDAGNQAAWWNVGIAATALKKERLAGSIWTKFGMANQRRPSRPASVRLSYNKQFEIMWVQRQSPALGQIRNIPHPTSGRRYGDMVLLDNIVRGYHTSDYYRLPIYDELGLFKRSNYRTFSCQLLLPDKEGIQLLQKLCWERQLGFEAWGHASRSFLSERLGAGQPEFYFFDQEEWDSELLVAIAAPEESQARQVLESWKVITLKDYSDFEEHRAL